jgi:hypothetical protein
LDSHVAGTHLLAVSHHKLRDWGEFSNQDLLATAFDTLIMSAIRTTPLIPQHEFRQIRSLTSAVPLPRSRRGIKHIALLCLGPVCVVLIWLFTGRRSPVSTISIPGSAAVEDLVRKGREGYQAAKQKAAATRPQRVNGKLRLDSNGEFRRSCSRSPDQT